MELKKTLRLLKEATNNSLKDGYKYDAATYSRRRLTLINQKKIIDGQEEISKQFKKLNTTLMELDFTLSKAFISKK